MQQLEFAPQFGAQLGVQVRQRLVEQVDARFAHERAPDRHALALAARELRRLAIEQGAQLQHLGRVAHAARHFGLRRAGDAQAERHVLLDRHRRVQRVRLEHHADSALARIGVAHVAPADFDGAARDVDQARDAVQQRGFAAARWAKQHEKFARRDLQIEVADDLVIAAGDAQFAQMDIRHEGQPFTAPAAIPRTNQRPEMK